MIGRVLTNLSDKFTAMGDDMDKYSKDLMISIIELISSTVSSQNLSVQTSSEILQYLSKSVENADIVSLLFRILDVSLNRRSYEVLSACMSFLNDLISS